MLTEIKIKNFRTFQKEVTLRLRPITIMIGKNNAGKSTIIKFILMLQQSLSNYASRFLEPEGEKLHLGAFAELKNKKERKRYLDFGLTYEVQSDLSTEFTERMVTIFKHLSTMGLQKSVETPFAEILRDKKQTVNIKQITVNIAAHAGYYESNTHGSQEMQAVLGDAVIATKKVNLHPDSRLLNFGPIEKLQDVSDFEMLLRDLKIERMVSPVRSELQAYKHLDPIRQEAKRVIVNCFPPHDSVGDQGEYTLPHLQRILQGAENRDFLLKHISEIAGISRISFKNQLKGYIADCLATNKDTTAVTHLSDFGFGVSQCIPVLVQGTIMTRKNLLIVEQPEAQLHPTAQLELGSFFADLWKEKEVYSLVETHSPNIILRLRRLVAKGELKAEDVSIAYFDVVDSIPVIKNLDIEENGNLEKGLPMEFFGADILEGMKLGARK